MRWFILALLTVCAHATPQFVKSAGVKGHSSIQHGYGYGGYSGPRVNPAINFDRGVCYIEVPTASLVEDPTHVPAGNGSRSDLSRIRSCCRGYTRNVYNYLICEPVCSNTCENGLCVAPETCSCYPDHVKNLEGKCVATCPIGCQNGRCSGEECICNPGYKLDSDRKYCIPFCRDDCGGIYSGKCVAPNRCECKRGYTSSPDGSCKPDCGRCDNGECVGPSECRCLPGYAKHQTAECEPQCANTCRPPSRCIAPNVCSNTLTTTTTAPYYQHIPNTNGNPSTPTSDSQYKPNYPGNQQPNYPGNQQSNYPGSQQTSHPGQQQNYPGHQQQQSSYPGYPGQQQPINLGSQQTSHPGQQQNYPGHQQQQSSYPGYPGQQQPINPGSQQTSHPGQQQNYPGHQQQQSSYPGYPGQQQPINPGSQQTSHPGQQQNYSGQQQQLINPGRQQLSNPGHQEHTYPGCQLPGLSGFQQPNGPSGQQPGYPTGQYYSGSQHPDPQRPNYGSQTNINPSANDREPYYPNSQYYPGQSNYQPHSPGSYPHPSQSPPSESQHRYPDSQSAVVDVVCHQTCVNGTCVGTDRCACNTGYLPIESDTSRCQPYCPSSCLNGTCIFPFVCVCDDGYLKDFSVKGRARCLPRRIRRSADDTSAPRNIAQLLIYEIPDYED